MCARRGADALLIDLLIHCGEHRKPLHVYGALGLKRKFCSRRHMQHHRTACLPAPAPSRPMSIEDDRSTRLRKAKAAVESSGFQDPPLRVLLHADLDAGGDEDEVVLHHDGISGETLCAPAPHRHAVVACHLLRIADCTVNREGECAGTTFVAKPSAPRPHIATPWLPAIFCSKIRSAEVSDLQHASLA